MSKYKMAKYSKQSVIKKEMEEDYRSFKIFFKEPFSLMKNLYFMEHIADAQAICFEKVFYVVCSNFPQANNLTTSLMCKENEQYNIKKVQRLGPAFCASKNMLSTDLRIVRLPSDATVAQLSIVLPSALDICLKRSMAVARFPSEAERDRILEGATKLLWPSAHWRPVVKKANKTKQLHDEENEENLDEDPNFLKFRHPKRFVEDINTVAVTLNGSFEIISDLTLLDKFKGAKDIFLSKSCVVSYNTEQEAWEAKRKLVGLASERGLQYVVWKKSAKTLPLVQEQEEEVEVKEEEEEEEVEEEDIEEEEEVVEMEEQERKEENVKGTKNMNKDKKKNRNKNNKKKEYNDEQKEQQSSKKRISSKKREDKKKRRKMEADK